MPLKTTPIFSAELTPTGGKPAAGQTPEERPACRAMHPVSSLIDPAKRKERLRADDLPDFARYTFIERP